MGLINVVYGTDNPYIMEAAAQSYQTNPRGLLGPWLVGNCFDWLFTGLLLVQVQKYFAQFPHDARWIKYLVVTVTVLSCLKTVQDFLLVWTIMVVRSGDYLKIAQGTWYIWVEPTTAQILSFTAEAFFVYRCFRLTNKNYFVLGGLVVTMLLVMVVSVFTTIRLKVDPFWVPGIRRYAIPALTANLCIDLFITGVVSWKLYTSKTGVHHETDSMLSRLMALTWETAAPPAISAILNVVFYVAAPETAVHMFFNMLTPRLYVFSFMHTLLVRPSIRSGSKSATDQEAGSSDATSKIRRVTTGNRHQLATFRKGHKENQSIGQTNTIPVQVQTETVIHTAPSDDYQRKKQSAGSIQLQGHPVVTISKPGDLSKFEEDNWSLGSSSSVNGKGDQKDSYHMYDVTNRKDGV